jgi:hypothetical protein
MFTFNIHCLFVTFKVSNDFQLSPKCWKHGHWLHYKNEVIKHETGSVSLNTYIHGTLTQLNKVYQLLSDRRLHTWRVRQVVTWQLKQEQTMNMKIMMLNSGQEIWEIREWKVGRYQGPATRIYFMTLNKERSYTRKRKILSILQWRHLTQRAV